MGDRYFAGENDLIAGKIIVLPADETHHLVKVMRQRPGANVQVFAGGNEAQATFVELEGKCARVHLVEVRPGVSLPDVKIHVVIPRIKGGRAEHVVQKVTELGAASICIYSADHEVVKAGESKLDRYQRVALEACKQCERASVPAIYEAPDLLSAFRSYNLPPQQCILLYERQRTHKFSDAVSTALQSSGSAELVLASGPEGGFSSRELASTTSVCTQVGFGALILRAETAPIAAVAAALALTANA